MAGVGEEFLIGDDLDAILAIIDEEIPEGSMGEDSQLSNVVEEVINDPSQPSFLCDECGKIYELKTLEMICNNQAQDLPHFQMKMSFNVL